MSQLDIWKKLSLKAFETSDQIIQMGWIALWKLQKFVCHGLFNPILTGLFESKFQLGRGQFDPPPPSDLGPKGADRRKILHGCHSRHM